MDTSTKKKRHWHKKKPPTCYDSNVADSVLNPKQLTELNGQIDNVESRFDNFMEEISLGLQSKNENPTQKKKNNYCGQTRKNENKATKKDREFQGKNKKNKNPAQKLSSSKTKLGNLSECVNDNSHELLGNLRINLENVMEEMIIPDENEKLIHKNTNNYCGPTRKNENKATKKDGEFQGKNKKNKNPAQKSSSSKLKLRNLSGDGHDDGHELLGSLKMTFEKMDLNNENVFNAYMRVIIHKVEADTGVMLKQIRTTFDTNTMTTDLLTTNRPSIEQANHACNIVLSFNLPEIKVEFLKREEINNQHLKAEVICQIEKFWNECLKKNDNETMELMQLQKDLVGEIEKLRSTMEKLNARNKLFNLVKEEADLKIKESKLQEKIELKRNEATEFAKVCQCFYDEAVIIDINDKNLTTLLGNISQRFGSEISTFNQSMPIYAYRSAIINSVTDHDVTILVAETGSGKSTQVVKYLLQNETTGLIACTQPRKLAARNLAEYVSLSYGGHVGDIVGYDFGFNKKFKENKTKIVFTTDYYLLQEWAKDPTLSKYESIIIDEAHERSLATDLLLSVLRQTVSNNKSREKPLNVVITSATIDPSVFRNYFAQLKVNILNVPGNIYPIAINWDTSPLNLSGNYLDRAVSKVKEVVSNCLSEKKHFGAMLVFVATPAETEKAQRALECESFIKKNKIVVLQLHGKLPLEDQQRVFKPKLGEQYVIITTNIAETSVTVPNVTIVIESGAVKERQYDAKRNISVLKVVPVNQSSSTQRKGRSGRTAPGICYYLYTKEDFDSFSAVMVPEIKRLPLDQCLLELFKLGITNPHRFTFMDPPSSDAIDNSLESLIYLEGIVINEDKDSYRLTDIGKKMSQFVIDPRLSKLLINVLEHDTADISTALALCAMVSNGGNIFFRQGTNEEKQTADVKKLQFSDDNSDFITMINVFYEWINSSKSDKARSAWCGDNSINGKSMKAILSSIKEFEHIIKQLFPNCPKPSFDNRVKEHDSQIINLITKCYGRNIAAYLGHPDLGYMTSDGDMLIIHPSSSLTTFGPCFPQFLIYDSVLTTSRSFMVHVSCVEDNNVVVNEFKRSQGGQLYYNSCVSCCQFGPIGNLSLRKCFIGQRYKLLQDLEKELKGIIELYNSKFTNFVKLEAEFTNCCLKLWCNNTFHGILLQFLKEKLKSYHDELRNELWKVQIDSSCVSVMLGRGGTVREPYLYGDYNEIKIKEPYDLSRIHTFMNKELPYFKDIGAFADGSCRILFNVPSEARLALFSLQCNIFQLELQTKQITSGPRSFNYTCRSNARIFLEYTRREKSGIGFIEFENELQSSMFVSAGILSEFSAKLAKNNKNTVYLRGLKDVDDQTIKDRVGDSYGDVKISLPFVKSFQTTDEDKECLISGIKQIMKNIGFNEIFYTITLLPFTEKNISFKFILHFQSIEVGCKAEKSLKVTNITICDAVQKSYSLAKFRFNINSTISCLEDVYVKFEKEIEEMCQGIEFNVKQVLGRRMIHLSSQELTLLSTVHADLQCLLNGETIEHNNMRLFFNESNWIKLCQIQTTVKAVIRRSASMIKPALILIGKQAAISAVKIFINKLLSEILNQDIRHHVMPLNDPSQPKGILKKLILTYNGDLQELRNMDGLNDIKLVLGRRQKLEISGHKNVVDRIEKQIDDLIRLLAAENNEFGSEETCAICFTEPEKDEKYRFELCGHLVCHICFQSQISAANFPLVCPQEDCAKELCVQDYKFVLQKSEPSKKKFMQLAIHEFISQPDHDYFNCPSPDCVNLFRKAKDGISDRQAVSCCGDCDKEICTRCCVVYHHDYTCAIYKLLNSDEDGSLLVWIRGDPTNRKRCTNCSAGIEKISGCNHMECIKCKSHMCWRCMRIFNTGGEVYNHQPYCEVVY